MWSHRLIAPWLHIVQHENYHYRHMHQHHFASSIASFLLSLWKNPFTILLTPSACMIHLSTEHLFVYCFMWSKKSKLLHLVAYYLEIVLYPRSCSFFLGNYVGDVMGALIPQYIKVLELISTSKCCPYTNFTLELHPNVQNIEANLHIYPKWKTMAHTMFMR